MKCGLSKTLKFFPQCLLLLSLVLFGGLGLGLKSVSATIIYDVASQYVQAGSATPCKLGTLTGTWTATSSLSGVADNITTKGSSFGSVSAGIVKCYNSDFSTTTLPLPSGYVVDYITFTTHASSTMIGTNLNGSLHYGASGYDQADLVFTTNLTYRYTNSLYTSWGANATNIQTKIIDPADTNIYFSLQTNGNQSTKALEIDSIRRDIFYHYDDTVITSRINSFTISPLGIGNGGNPYVASATSTITTTYYKNSTDSTGYTVLQYQLHNWFTNVNQYATVPLTTDTTFATSTLTNFCSNSFWNCANGDTYQVAVRFSNATSSVVSGWFSPQYYFAYIAYTPTPTATTSVIIIGNGQDTGTTTIDINAMYTDCGLTNLGGCLQNALVWAFIPSSASIQHYYDFTTLMTIKAPMGYFTVVKNNINGLNSTSTPAFSVVIPSHLKTYFFNPFDIGIAGILWFFFALNFYKRLKHITV